MIKKTIRTCLLAVAFGLLPSLGMALEMPKQGMTMDQVRAANGAPARNLGAVGKPPITRWVYDGFTVYFENSRVIHTVRTQSLGSSPAPVVAPMPAAKPAPEMAPAYAPTDEPAPIEYAVPALASPSEPAGQEIPITETAPAEAAPAIEDIPVAAPAEPIPAPGLAPAEAAPATTTPVGGGFRFDPVSGRLIIDDENAAAAAEPAAESAPASAVEPALTEPAGMEVPVAEPTMPMEPAPAEPVMDQEPAPIELAPESSAPTPEPAAAPVDSANGSVLDDTLEFDPDTGTFRPKKK